MARFILMILSVFIGGWFFGLMFVLLERLIGKLSDWVTAFNEPTERDLKIGKLIDEGKLKLPATTQYIDLMIRHYKV